jgi:4-hydroxy-tetrahydrodipicolinate reductase
MGATVCDAVDADPDLSLVAAFDSKAGDDIVIDGGARRVSVDQQINLFLQRSPDVVVDFTVAAAAKVNLVQVAAAGVHAVVGTTGLEDGDIGLLEQSFESSNCLVASNFAISAVLMMRFAEIAAPFFETAEIIELHHDRKIDAPSGTAISTVERMAAASDAWAEDPTEHEVYPGARGGIGPSGIRVHSVRMRGMVAHQEVILGAVGQSLTIRQDSYDRTSFMPGVVLACKHIADHPGVTVGLDALLDI